MPVETTVGEFRKQLEQIVTDDFVSTFTGVLFHPVIPFDDIQFPISRNNPLRRQVVHPVPDRGVE